VIGIMCKCLESCVSVRNDVKLCEIIYNCVESCVIVRGNEWNCVKMCGIVCENVWNCVESCVSVWNRMWIPISWSAHGVVPRAYCLSSN